MENSSNQKDKKYFYKDSVQQVISFEKKLNKLGILIKKDSDLNRIGYNVLEVYEKHLNVKLHDDTTDIREYMAEYMGFNNFISKIMPLLDSQYIDEIKPHLELLSNSSIPLNIKSKVTDQGSNKLFELYIASLCASCFSNIKVDPIKKSIGDNPDIIFDHLNKKWGIACKVLHSAKTKTLFDNVEKGVHQIEVSSSDTGFVFLNLKNIIDYNTFWPITNQAEYDKGKELPEFASYASIHKPINLLHDIVLGIQREMIKEIGVSNLIQLFEGKKAQPVIVIFLQATTGILVNSKPVFTILGFLDVLRIKEPLPEAMNVLSMINDQIQ